MTTQDKVNRLNEELEAAYAAGDDRRADKLEIKIDDLEQALDCGADYSGRGEKIRY